ncbi:MAG: NifU family protein [Armatimonadetes bacterium]|nr:NifU family protein [Armatimonadota bacterium]
MREKVEKSLEGIRPALQLDGGDVELVGIEDGVVKVKLEGACHGCPMAAMTLQMGIERVLKRDVPEIKGVEAVSGLFE